MSKVVEIERSGAHERSTLDDICREGARRMLAAALEVEADFEISDGEEAAASLLDLRDPPTAIFAFNDNIAIGATRTARNRGLRLPEDLSIVGFDDTEMRYGVYPELTAVCQNARALAAEAFNAIRQLVERGDGGPEVPAMRKPLRTWFEIHESTAPPRA